MKFYNSLLRTLIFLGLLAFKTLAQNNSPVNTDSVTFTSSNLPIFVIDTYGQEIVDEPKIQVGLGVIYNGKGNRNFVNDPFNHFKGKAGIEIRGSSSQMFPKKSYSVETRDSLGNDLKVPLLGMPSEADWVLLASYNEKTLMRDVLLYDLVIGMGRYASRSQHVELILNGKYMGVYVLLEKIKRGTSRVNIAKMSTTDTTGDAVTGGYIFSIDRPETSPLDWWYSSVLPYPNSPNKVAFQHVYPKGEDLAPQQRQYIQDRVMYTERILSSYAFADTAIGYPKLLDVDSFIDQFIAQELTKNVDGYRLSMYLYKERDSKGGKLSAGPVWDFNIAFGNADYGDGWKPQSWQILNLTDYGLIGNTWCPPAFWRKLFDDTAFKTKLAHRWQYLRGKGFSNAKIMAKIDSLGYLLNESQQRNFVKWPVMGTYVWPNYYIGQTFSDEITYLKQWITTRVAWLDNATAQVTAVDEVSKPSSISFTTEVYPNPATENAILRLTSPSEADINVSLYNILGEKIEDIYTGKLSTYTEELIINTSALAKGIYFCKTEIIQNGSKTIKTNKICVIK